jgi:CRP-like cAMP-binding protein
VLIVVLHEAGVETATLFTGSAVVGAGLGLALRDTLGNFVAGLVFQWQQPFQLGDWIQFDDKPHHIGKVIEINWRETKVVTLDEAELTLPNGTLAVAYIRNFTKPQEWSRRSLYVTAPYDVPPHRVQEIIRGAIADSFGVLAEPPPSVVTYNFSERGIEYWVRFFTTEFGRRDRVDGEARDRIWYALARHGIRIPVATHEVRMTPLPPPPPEPVAERRARRERLLRQIDVMGVLPDECVQNIAERAREVLYGPGEKVIRQGEPGQSLYLIEEGEVVITAANNGQAPVEVSRLRAASFFGEMSLLTGAARAATVTALTECRLLEVDKAAFQAELTCHPELAEQLGAVLAERQRVLAERLHGSDSARAAEKQKDFFEQIREFFALS